MEFVFIEQGPLCTCIYLAKTAKSGSYWARQAKISSSRRFSVEAWMTWNGMWLRSRNRTTWPRLSRLWFDITQQMSQFNTPASQRCKRSTRQWSVLEAKTAGIAWKSPKYKLSSHNSSLVKRRSAYAELARSPDHSDWHLWITFPPPPFPLTHFPLPIGTSSNPIYLRVPVQAKFSKVVLELAVWPWDWIVREHSTGIEPGDAAVLFSSLQWVRNRISLQSTRVIAHGVAHGVALFNMKVNGRNATLFPIDKISNICYNSSAILASAFNTKIFKNALSIRNIAPACNLHCYNLSNPALS